MTAKLELYRVFKAVAETGNISAAAQNLYISQSAISQSIKQLENQLDVRLFMRTPRGVNLTEEGRMLYQYVSRAISTIENGEECLAQMQNLLRGTLVIGASDTVTKRFLLPVLQKFHQDFPALKIQIINGTTSQVLEHLRGGRVDLAFATSPFDDTEYDSIRCFENHHIFVASPDYDCDFSHEYTLEELTHFPLIMLERTASSRRFLESVFLQHGLKLQPEIELGSHNLLVSLARIGFGIAGVTQEFAQSGLIRGVVCPLRIKEEIPTRYVSMCTLKKVHPSAATAKFMEYIQEHVRKTSNHAKQTSI